MIPHVEQLAIHFQVDGNLIHKESDDAKRQIQIRKDHPEIAEAEEREASSESSEKNVGTTTTGTGGDADDDDDDKQRVRGSTGGKEKKLTNQFNFSERASQTYNNPMRDRTTMTEPPPRATFSSNATQWEIYDAYLEDFEQQVLKKTVLIPFYTL